jgi:hypothetical protein
MKEKLLFIACFFILNGCNMSDDVIDLPGGSTYIIEGSCSNRLAVGFRDVRVVDRVGKGSKI